MTDRDEGVATRLRDVVFSYDREASLPDPNATDSDASASTGRDAVLRGVDLDVPMGSFAVIMGASGGGKSTLLRTLNGLIPDFITGSFAGEVEVLGRDATATRVSELATDVGMVLQDYESQLFGTSVTAEVAFGPENLAVPPAEIDDRIDDALALAGLSDLDRRREPAALSGGQKQRLVFAGVAAMRPDLLVLDEPTSDLDPSGTRRLLSAVGRLAGGRLDRLDAVGRAETVAPNTAAPDDGVCTADDEVAWTGPETVVMVTHKIEEALLADHAILLEDGRVSKAGPAREVFTDTAALRASRVAIPPLVAAFDEAGVPAVDLPLTPAEAVDVAAARGLSWTPPARLDDDRSATEASATSVPAGTGETLGEPCFELENVVFAYETDRGQRRAVDEVSLTIRTGEVVAIVGHNGSGKTTLAKHLNGLHVPDAGQVHYDGREVTDYSMSAIGRDVGYVFQNPDHQLFADTVREEVKFGPQNFGISGEALDQRVSQALETVELTDLADADPFALSRGQRQRVALAGILATDPAVIVFDEPTTGLDATQRNQFMGLVAELNRTMGLTVVAITHSMDTVARYAPRTVVLEDGQVAYDGSTRRLFADRDRLDAHALRPPHVVEASNRLAAARDLPDALPALSVAELAAGLGGGDV
jgi:energy-coupling factor transport system ATP-binding protein